MNQYDYVAQPKSRTTLDAIESILQCSGVLNLDVAAAYITSGGVSDLMQRSKATLGDTWTTIQKRWLTSFDYCRTEPVALESLLSAPSSEVRIHDAEFCVNHGCMPRVPFHPKAFFVHTDERDYVLTGSGNVSRSGLSRGIEAGLVLCVNRSGPSEPSSKAAMQALRDWFSATWANATPLSSLLLTQYSKRFESAINLKMPTPTEDDLASSDVPSGGLSGGDLQKLRVCRNLWIQAGNITKNRGPSLPGNQLMMKRLSRVFFGFPPTSVAENTAIGTIQIRFYDGVSGSYSLTYSDNKMDKLVLPIPGSDGPAAYDNQCLHFKRVGPKMFVLKLGSDIDRATWLKKSEGIDGAFRMASGRKWGVF